MSHQGISGRDRALRTLVTNNPSGIELKAENDNRSKRSDGPYWRSATSYNAIFDEETQTVVKDSTITVTVTLTKHTDFNDILGLSSAVHTTIPVKTGSVANNNPSAMLAIRESLIDRIKTVMIPGTQTMALYPWVHPQLVIPATVQPEDGPYVYVFEIELPGTKRAALEAAIALHMSSPLEQTMLSQSNNTLLRDIFSGVRIEIKNPVDALVTRFDKALDFNVMNFANIFRSTQDGLDNFANSVDNYRHAESPLMRVAVSSFVAVPASHRTVTNSACQPWAMATILKAKLHDKQTIFSYTGGAGTTGIWLEIEAATTLTLKVGTINEKLVELVYTDDPGVPKVPAADTWIGLVLTWNGYATSDMTATQAASAYTLKLVDLDINSSNVKELRWTHTYMHDTGSGTYNPSIGDPDFHMYAIGGVGFKQLDFKGQMVTHVCTTLLANDDLPTDYEVSMMVRNPSGWLQSYKKGNPYRNPENTAGDNPVLVFELSPAVRYSTQVWLMGNAASGASSQDGVVSHTHPLFVNGLGYCVYNVAVGETDLSETGTTIEPFLSIGTDRYNPIRDVVDAILYGTLV
jgi:hypothetical protein